MTLHWAAVLLAAATAAPAEVSTLDGAVVSGTVTALDAKAVTVETGGGPKAVPLDSVLEVRFPGDAAAPAAEPSPVTVWLAGGGKVSCADVAADQRQVTLTVAGGSVAVPRAAVRAVRFRPADAAVDAKWDELLEGSAAKDLLVVRNAEVLDRLDGTVGRIDAAALTFVVGDTTVPVPRDKPKLYGVVFAAPAEAPAAPACVVRLRNGDRLPAAGVALAGDALRATLAGGGALALPAAAVEAIDFGLGKVRFLSTLEPSSRRHTPYIGEISVFDVRVDRNDDGGPIRIDGRTFAKGLVVHSRTELTYRLAGEYRRFVATAGIEDVVRSNGYGHVVLSISADGKELLNRPVAAADSPIPLDLDVSGARELTIVVDYGEVGDVSDHLALGDARLIK